MFQKIESKLPTRLEIFPVYSVILFVTFTWTLYVIFWTLPSWMGDMNLWRILDLAAYILSFALIESVFIMLGILLLAFLLPARLFRDHFIPQGSVLAVMLGVGSYFVQPHLGNLRMVRNLYLAVIPFIFLGGVVLLLTLFSLVFERAQNVTNIITTFAERMTVFSYFYLPLGMISVVISVFKIIL
jgi:hypothetical protein